MIAPPEMNYATGVQRAREALAYATEGPIADGLARRDVTEVLVDPSGRVFYDVLFGTLEEQPVSVHADRLTSIILAIAGLLGKTVNDGTLSGEFPLDGSRIQAWLEPSSIGGPAISIRKRRKQGEDGWPALTLADYMMGQAVRDAFDEMIYERLNLLIVGATSAGKSGFFGAYLRRLTALRPDARIVTIEDTQELSCDARSYLPLHTNGIMDQRALLRTGMRARPDALFVGEVRGPEAIDLVMSLNTGHPGGSTVHGPSCVGGLTRVWQLCRLGGEDTIGPEMIADAFQYVALMRRLADGSRVIASLEKTCGFENKRFQLTPVT